VSRVVQAILPVRLGRSFRWLFSSSLCSNLGDGVALAAGPLLVASQTRDPLLVAMAALLQRLPWLLFGLFAGAIVDRLDRKTIVIGVDVLRAVVIGLLAVTITTDVVSITVVLLTMFVLGTAETFADVASSTMLPATVDHGDLGIANARMQGSMLVTNQLVGPPIGAAMFAAGMVVPFVTQAVCCVLGALLVTRVSTRAVADADRASGTVRENIREGLGWLWRHPPMRTLALTIIAFNVTFGAAWSVLVLYASDRLGMSDLGFGLLTTALAVGGLGGILGYGWLERHFSLGNIMRAGLVIETLTHLALAITTSPVVAVVVMAVFGAHAFVWGTTSTTVRQRSVPAPLLGRVTSVYMVGLIGGLVVGAGLGGVIARIWGVTGPFWFAFAGSAVLLVVLWRALVNIAHAADEVSFPRVHELLVDG